MCRNIRVLLNFDPPTTDEEIRAAALQYVRKVSGFTKPSQVNQEAFDRAVDAVTAVSTELLASLETAGIAPDTFMERVLPTSCGNNVSTTREISM